MRVTAGPRSRTAIGGERLRHAGAQRVLRAPADLAPHGSVIEGDHRYAAHGLGLRLDRDLRRVPELTKQVREVEHAGDLARESRRVATGLPPAGLEQSSDASST